MRQRIIKISIFITVFFISLFITSMLINKDNPDMTVEMKAATLPLINMNVDGYDVNTLFGYTGEMQEKYIRETLTPVRSDKQMKMHIDTKGSQVSSITVEVRSCSLDRLVEKTELKDYVSSQDGIYADFSIKDLIEYGKEYMLVIRLAMSDGGEASYYTRMIENDDFATGEMLEFVKDFHDSSFDKEKCEKLAMYMESNEEGDNSTFHKVNIHSSLSQLSWGSLNISSVGEPRIMIYEMDSSLASIGVDYEMELEGREKNEKYLVREFYRIRHTNDRIYLLDFERTMSQIFDPEGQVFVNDKIVLGIIGDDVELSENPEGNTVVYSQCNALYEYRNSDGLLARLFSFYDDNNWDTRTLNDMHGIKVLSVDEPGNVYFIVYGYMNRGRHEGEVGVAVFYYDNTGNYIEEKLFIPYSRSWAMLMEDVDRLSFVNRNNEYYVYLDKTLYRMNLDGQEMSVLSTDLNKDSIMASENGQVAAWMEDDHIVLMDLNSSATREIETVDGQGLKLIGFLGDDVVYGILSSTDVLRDMSGIVTIPMHTIKIEDKNGNELKSYGSENMYVINADISGRTLHLKRVKKNPENGRFRVMEDDQIMDNEKLPLTQNKLMQVVTANKESVTQIALLSNVNSTVKLQIPSEVLLEGNSDIVPESTSHEDEFYVYGKGGFAGTFQKAYEAVNTASVMAGCVLNDDMEYVWQKGNRVSSLELDWVRFSDRPADDESGVSPLARCLGAMLGSALSQEDVQLELDEGKTAIGILEEYSEKDVYDLSGCEMSDVLYYVSKGEPVLATVEGDRVVLIVGYDEKNTIIMEPYEKTKYKKGLNDSKEWFEEGRNRFVVLSDPHL